MDQSNPSSKTERRCNEIIVIKGKPQTCNALLFRGELNEGRIEIKCQRCGKITVIMGNKQPVLRKRIFTPVTHK
jgi:phage FluMu protein Com